MGELERLLLFLLNLPKSRLQIKIFEFVYKLLFQRDGHQILCLILREFFQINFYSLWNYHELDGGANVIVS